MVAGPAGMVPAAVAKRRPTPRHPVFAAARTRCQRPPGGAGGSTETGVEIEAGKAGSATAGGKGADARGADARGADARGAGDAAGAGATCGDAAAGTRGRTITGSMTTEATVRPVDTGMAVAAGAAGLGRKSCRGTGMRLNRPASPGIGRTGPAFFSGAEGAKCRNAPASCGGPRLPLAVGATIGAIGSGTAPLSGSLVKSTHWMSRQRGSPRSLRAGLAPLAGRGRAGTRSEGIVVESGMTAGGSVFARLH